MAKLTQLFHEPGALLNDFVVDWSKDNKIAVATQHSVCIYEVKCKPHEKELTAAGVLTKIMPEKEQNLCFDKDIPLQTICREKHQRTTDVFLDTSIMAITSQHDTFTGFRRALWSPPGMAARDSCLLATLSWDRRLRVYEVQTAGRPRLLAEPSAQWIQHHAQPPSKVKNLEDVRQRANALSIIDMAWTPACSLRGGVLGCHLVTVTRSGHMAVWRLTAGSDQVRLVSFWTVPDPEDRVTCITCLDSGVLLLGRYSGVVTGYGLGLGDEVTVTDAWPILNDEDRVAVTSIIASGLTSSDHPSDEIVMLSKGFAVVALRLTRDENTATVSGTTFVPLEGAQVTGLSLLSPGRALVSTLYNQFWSVGLSAAAEDDTLQLVAEPVSILLEPIHYSCHALAVSPNGVIVCTVERVFDYYDHLVLREPIRVSFTLLDRQLDSLFNDALDTTVPLHRLSDVLEAARLTMLVDKSPFSLVADEEALAQQSARHLQCTLFMACSSQALRVREIAPPPANAGAAAIAAAAAAAASDKDGAEMAEYTEQLRWYLMRAHLKDILRHTDKLASDPGAARSAAKQWEPFRRRAKAVLAPGDGAGRLERLAAVMPVCGVCQDGVATVTSLRAVCKQGHKLPVCCQTLALCDTAPYRRCEQCGAFAVDKTETETGLDLGPWCTFCDGRLSCTG